jgi:hypothetical protein
VQVDFGSIRQTITLLGACEVIRVTVSFGKATPSTSTAVEIQRRGVFSRAAYLHQEEGIGRQTPML